MPTEPGPIPPEMSMQRGLVCPPPSISKYPEQASVKVDGNFKFISNGFTVKSKKSTNYSIILIKGSEQKASQ